RVGGKVGEGWQGSAITKGRIATTRDQLLRLCKKLDFANTTTAELDVVPFDRDFTVTTISVDLTFHGVNVGESDEVEVFSPHKRCQLVKNCFARRDIARTRTGLYHGRALPVLSDTLVIRKGRCF